MWLVNSPFSDWLIALPLWLDRTPLHFSVKFFVCFFCIYVCFLLKKDPAVSRGRNVALVLVWHLTNKRNIEYRCCGYTYYFWIVFYHFPMQYYNYVDNVNVNRGLNILCTTTIQAYGVMICVNMLNIHELYWLSPKNINIL